MSRFLTFVIILAFLVISSFLSLYWQIYSVDSKASRQVSPSSGGSSFEDLAPARHVLGAGLVGKSSFEHSFRQRHLINWKLFKAAPPDYAINLLDGRLGGQAIKGPGVDSKLTRQDLARLFSNDGPRIPFDLLLKAAESSLGGSAKCTLQMAVDMVWGALESDIRAMLISKLEYRRRLWNSLPPPHIYSISSNDPISTSFVAAYAFNRTRELVGNLSETTLRHQASALPPIYIITATIHKNQQKADLTRLSQTLMLVPNVHWIVVEDSPNRTRLVANLLRRSGLSYTHLNVETPAKIKEQLKSQPYRPRGSEQRNKGIEWLRQFHQHALATASKGATPSIATSPDLGGGVWSFYVSAMATTITHPGKRTPGVVYFADDDNSYDLQIFEEMRNIKKVGVWPVGLVGGLMLEKPAVSPEGKVKGWVVAFGPHRPFALDMAGFAINLDLLLSNPAAKFEVYTYVGFVESSLLKRLVTIDHLEPLAENCTKVYVWHTKTQSPELQYEEKFTKQFKHASNMGIEV